ncbi:MAG: acyl-CoA thioesterase [Alphaproteobacteria bacterium]|nr:acyl-CoA thioesterase [Alphaproteobacteria bacterium]MCB9930405.1 acyl-CoA thioesterase [Alphaproteobacteria bacterium]
MAEPLPTRADYRHFLPIQTRWNDMDRYGHVNNMVYYGYMDTVVTDFIIRHGGLDTAVSPVVGLVIESQCRYHRPIGFPAVIEAGLRVGKLGNSSVRYEVGIFTAGDDALAAHGHFVHVYVTRADNRPTPIPMPIRTALEPLVVA